MDPVVEPSSRLLRVKHRLSAVARRTVPSAGGHPYLLAAALVALLAGTTVLWFYPVPYDAFTADDLALILRALSGNDPSDKYRPAFSALAVLEVTAFGREFSRYILFNMALEFANACLVSLLAWRLTNRSNLVALAAGCITITSRFSYYSVYQVWGPVEGLSLTFLLLLVLTVLNAFNSPRARAWLWPVLLFLLLIHTHERYVAVAVFPAAAALLSPSLGGRVGERMVLAAAPFLVVVANFAIKTYLLHTEFFLGTEGKRIAFDYRAFGQLMAEGVINLLGFNAGASPLSGLKTTPEVPLAIALGAAFALTVSAILVVYARTQWPLLRTDDLALLVRRLILSAALLLPLLAAASITIRQEYRWLYAPYVLFILGLVYALSHSAVASKVRLALALLLLVSAVGLDSFYRRYVGNTFFMDSLRVAESAKVLMIYQHGAEMYDREVFLAVPEDAVAVRPWYFNHDEFFKFYTRNQAIHVTYVTNVDSIPYRTLPLDAFLAFGFDETTRQVFDLMPKVREMAQYGQEWAVEPTTDFVAVFDRGSVTAARPTNRSTQTGVRLSDAPTAAGSQRAIVVDSGSAYSFDDVPLGDNPYLTFSASVPFAESDGAFAFVDVTTEKGYNRAFGAELPPPLGGKVRWRDYVVPLTRHAGLPARIVFGVETRAGAAVADSIAFREPQIRTAMASGQ